MNNCQNNKEDQNSADKKRITIVGDVGVGKTAIVRRFSNNFFENIYEPTIGANYTSKVVYNNGKNVRLQIWDCAGKEVFKTLVETYVVNSDAILIMFDDEFSFQHSKERLVEIRNKTKGGIVFLVQNKCDKKSSPELSAKAEKYAAKKEVFFAKVSALKDCGVTELFEKAVSRCYTNDMREQINKSKEEEQRELTVPPSKRWNCFYIPCVSW